MNNPAFRIGHGFDIHALADNRDLILGGIKIPYHRGLVGHSDADCLIHALSDAMLGAFSSQILEIIFQIMILPIWIWTQRSFEKVRDEAESLGYYCSNDRSYHYCSRTKTASIYTIMKIK